MTEAFLEKVYPWLSRIKVPQHYDRVYKDECMFSFSTPLSPGGLYLNLSTLQSFSRDYIQLDYERTNFPLYLHETQTKVPLPEEELEKLESKPEKMAIGMEGGFQVDKDKFTIDKTFELVMLSEFDVYSIKEPYNDLPLQLSLAVTKIQEHTSAFMQEETAAWMAEKIISKYSDNLEQLPAEKTISMKPEDWICEDSRKNENLWLNLSTGYIGSGRPNWDGTGGTGAALKHYESTGKRYPLAVKLGTITPSGADVYSYAPEEDCMVIDPKIEQHLRHWGIDMKQMEQTEKTMDEMELELNQSFEFNRITEAETTLVPVAGPCYVGLKNLGNSCYMNAVVQVLWMVPAIRERYLTSPYTIFRTANEDPSVDFTVQMSKLGNALINGKTGQKPPEEGEMDMDAWSVRPLSFKTLIGHGHVDFSSAHQQDAAHYFMHLLDVISTAEQAAGSRLPSTQEALTSSMFTFQTEERLYCSESNRVSYNNGQGVVLELDIPLEMAVNKGEVNDYKDRQMKRQKLQESGADAEILIEPTNDGNQKVTEITKEDKEDKVLPKVPFHACLSSYVGDMMVDDYYCRHLKRRTQAVKSTKLKTFPPFLMIQLKRYYMDETWHPKKMEVLVEAPDTLELENFRAAAHPPNEDIRSDSDDDDTKSIADSKFVQQLKAMDFPENGCIRAAIAVNNASLEAATEWILTHLDDPEFNTPIQEGVGHKPNSEAVTTLASMGFPVDACKAALIESKDDVDSAVYWLISHTEELSTLVPSILNKEEAVMKPEVFLDGEGQYELVGFISHMGSSTLCGHYVCHIKKNGRWILFNDEKVAVSELPPMELGYMYLYRRQDIQGLLE